MKKVLFILIFFLFIVISCKESKNKKSKTDTEPEKQKSETLIDESSFSYSNDSTYNDVAVLMITPDGETEYVVGNPKNIFQKTKSGLEYKYIISGKGKKYPKTGDVVHIVMEYRTEKDSLVFHSNNLDTDFKMKLTPPSHPGGSIEEAFAMLSEGDSAVFKINAANFLIYTQKNSIIPEYIKPEDKFIFYIKMNKIVDGGEFVKENSDTYKYYIEQERSLIDRIAMGFDAPRTITRSGLNIFSISKGSGKKVKPGDLVTINYTASFIDGTVFDSTIERNKPFRFVMGNKEVIDGLEEGVGLMNIGDHNILVIPFRLAYGDVKQGIIPPFSTLIFEIELINAE